ncbi:MAG TPA: hypothetical protein VFG30_26410, partial [Polyangiales bacterium]|nr:hypothetical protein [Polyangiales bacterium]
MSTFQTPRAVKLATSIASALALLAGCSPDTSNASGGKLPVRSIAGSSATPGIAGAFASGVAGGTASLPVTSNPAASSPIVGLAGAPAPTMPVAAPSGVAGAPAAPRPPVMPATPPPAQMPVVVTPNQKLPAVTDYAAPGPFPAREIDSTGPGGAYTMFRPTNLDANGFKFIPATWGNGITTTPQFYPWLTTVASHGFVIIAANTSTVTPDDMTKGLDWLIMQNDQAGDLQGKLDTSRAVCIGYSLGGGG